MYLKSCALLLCSSVSMLSAIVTPGMMPASVAACSVEITTVVAALDKSTSKESPKEVAAILYYAFPGDSAPVYEVVGSEKRNMLSGLLRSPSRSCGPCGR